MNILSRVLLRLGYVRLKDYGYMMTAEGRIVELARVTDDCFAPPPWEPIAWQSATAFLPAESPPRPRPLPPPPESDDSMGVSGTVSAPETRAPVAAVVAGTTVGSAGEVNPPAVLAPPVVPPRTEPEDEEWEWRMALARARERAARAIGRPPQPPGRIPAGLASALDRLPPGAELDGANFAEGSRRHPIARAEPGDVTVTDVSIHSAPPALEDDATRVDDGTPIDPDALESVNGEPVTSIMFVPPPPPPAPSASAGDAPLPRASTRLRRNTPEP